MLHVLWIILKIILIILAIILGLVLLVTLLVLFAPVRYKLAADIDDDVAVTAKVRFLIVSINIIFQKNDKKLDTFLRIVGIKFKLGDKDGKGKKEKKSKKEKKNNSENHMFSETDSSDENSMPDVEDGSEKKELSDSVESAKTFDSGDVLDKDTVSDALEDEEDLTEYDLWNDEDTLDGEDKKLFGRIKKLFKKSKKTVEDLDGKSEDEIKETLYQKLEKKVNQISEKKEEIDKKISRFQRFWNMKCTVRTREYLGKYLISILKHIAPKKVKGHIRYGFDEPCTTGQVTGYLSLLPFVYQKGFSLEPDFRERVVEGNITLKGRIILGYLARIVLKRYIWQTIKMARKI